MAFDEEFYTPRMISYLDLYVVAGKQPHANHATTQKVGSYSKDVLFGVPQLEYKHIMQSLWEMGVDTRREVEERVCWHKPMSLAIASRNEDKPKIYGLAFFGFERRDNEWLEEKAKLDKGVV